ncbi:hypothetical protein Lal_00000826 [Lupinus albus]|nr:hypothetical protein Lal_00000826 [Lupinus albus]
MIGYVAKLWLKLCSKLWLKRCSETLAQVMQRNFGSSYVAILWLKLCSDTLAQPRILQCQIPLLLPGEPNLAQARMLQYLLVFHSPRLLPQLKKYKFRVSHGRTNKVTLKERESFRTADSQVILEKALGLPQYHGRIHGAGFGASKQLLTPSGIINNCKLFLDTPCPRAVAIDTVYNTHDAIIHHAQIPLNHLKISIDISVEDDALLPIPVDEDIITIGLALATFVAWPKHLIDVVPIMGKVSTGDNSATSPPRIDEPASKKAKVVKSTPQSSKSNLELSGENLPADSTINISLPKSIYGFPTEEFITRNDVKDVRGRDSIGAFVLSVYIWYLYDNFVPKSEKKVMFISPQTNILGVGMVTNDTWKKQQSQLVAKIIEENKQIVDLFFAPLNTGQHWILVVINRISNQLFYFDSLKNGDPSKYPVMQDIFNTALNLYRDLNTKRQTPAKWTHVKTSHQNNNTDCGFMSFTS